MIAFDKLGHFVVGVLVALVALAFTGLPWVALLAPVVIGFAKEVYDSTGRGTVDFGDFVATGLGGLAVVAGVGLVA